LLPAQPIYHIFKKTDQTRKSASHTDKGA